jgi:anti-sigma-K factor RskA
MPETDPTLDELAAEYALGLLDGEDGDRAEARQASDPAFALAVKAWRERLAPLADEAPLTAPPPELWDRISRRLDGADNVIVLRLRRRLAVWRGAAGLVGAAAACLAIALVWPRPQPAAAPVLMAKLGGPSGPPAFVALYEPARKRYILAPVSVTGAPGRSPELWLLPSGGGAIPLGVADFQRTAALSAPQTPSAPGALLAVSIEPLGGSPTGKPTGPVVATGKLQPL